MFQVIPSENNDGFVQYTATVTPQKNVSRTIILGKKQTELGTKIIENDEVRVWAEFIGETTYNSTGNGVMNVPAFYIDAYNVIGAD